MGKYTRYVKKNKIVTKIETVYRGYKTDVATKY